DLLAIGCGVTNVVARATASADELTEEDLIAGGKILRRKLRRYRPRVLAVLGAGAYPVAFAGPDAAPGPQREQIAGLEVWVLPNPSGLNAHYQLPELARRLREVMKEADR